MKVRNPMRRSSVCFLHFLHPSLTLDCSIWLRGKSFPNPFNGIHHQMEQKESQTCSRSIPTLECFRCSSTRALGTGKVWVQDVHADCEGVDQRVSHALSASGNYLGVWKSSSNVEVGTLVTIPAYRLLSCSLSLLAHFHAVGHHICGWMNAIPYKQH